MKTTLKVDYYAVCNVHSFLQHFLTKLFFKKEFFFSLKKDLYNYLCMMWLKILFHLTLKNQILQIRIWVACDNHDGIIIRHKYSMIDPPTYRDIHPNSFHIHFINEKHKRFVPIRIQVARFDAGLLFLANSFALKVRERKIV